MASPLEIDEFANRLHTWSYSVLMLKLLPDLEKAMFFSHWVLVRKVISKKAFKVSMLTEVFQRAWKIEETSFDVQVKL